MKRFSILLLSALTAFSAFGQSFRSVIDANPRMAASNYIAYPAPVKALTPAPEGYEAVYISHYGRHGSRWLTSKRGYLEPMAVLERADSLGVLTEKGKEVLGKLRRMYTESYNRWGELTELGAVQHQQIAKRMYERFPSVFRDSVWIDAKSTVVIRCILSMENELQQFLRLNPTLRIRHDASEHDMYYMNLSDKKLSRQKETPEAVRAYRAWCDKNVNHSPIFDRLFTVKDFVKPGADAYKFAFDLFKAASVVQNSEIRHELDLFDLYTKDEIYRQWQQENVWWYLHYGPAPHNGGTQPFSQRNLLRKMIAEADSCLQYPRPGATLRFGHETMVLPLTCLMEINNSGKQIKNLDDLEKEGWINARIFPMGANIQLIFYRSAAKPSEILVKALLNEEEATLPLPKTGTPYYYKWSDFKAYYLKKLEGYKG